MKQVVELQLTRTPRDRDRDRYTLDGVGTLRQEGGFSCRATAEAAGDRRAHPPSRILETPQATDTAGVVAGIFDQRLRGGGTLCWHGRELALRRASMWRER